MEGLKTFIPGNREKLLCVMLAMLALFYTGRTIVSRISISPTDSVGYHVFLRKNHFSQADIQENTLVVMPLYTHIRPHCWPCLVVKYAKCMAGQRLNVKYGNMFFCNNEYLGTAKACSKKGVPVKAFHYSGIIPEGRFFAMGTSADSYDSRYTGLENINDVKAIAVPLF